MYTQNHNKKILLFVMSKYIRMKKQIQRSIVLKYNMKKLMTSSLPMVEKVINKKINKKN